MHKARIAAKTDANEKAIVKALRMLGYSVQTGVDDIFVGANKKNYWFEIKNPNLANKDGKVFESAIKPSQKLLRDTWKGLYFIVTTLDEILEIIKNDK